MKTTKFHPYEAPTTLYDRRAQELGLDEVDRLAMRNRIEP